MSLGGEQCCDAVVDPISMLATIAAIAALSLYLRQAVIDFMIKMARNFGRKKRRSLDILETVYSGKTNCYILTYRDQM